MAFGYGAHTCPGRFFAGTEIKLIMAHLIKNFDLDLKDKTKGRPANMKIALQLRPDPTAEVLFRRITEDLGRTKC